MTYWLILFSIPLIAQFAKDSARSRNRAFAFSAFILVLFSSLRADTIGFDLTNYIPAFLSLANTPWEQIFETSWEPGYMVFTKLISSISSDKQLYLCATSIATLTGVFIYIKRHSPIPWLSLYIYVSMGQYGMTMNSIRSSIALSILLLSVKFLLDRNARYFCITVLIAMLFHKSSFFFFLAYPITGLKFTLKYFIATSALAILLSYLLGGTVIDYFRHNIFDDYAEDGTVSTSIGAGYNLAIVLFFLTLVCYYLYNRFGNERNNKIVNVFFQLMFLAVFFQFLTPYMAGLSRISRIFYCSYIVLIPMVIHYCFIKSARRITIFFIVGLFAIYMSFSFFKISEFHSFVKGVPTNNQGTLPYRFFWE